MADRYSDGYWCGWWQPSYNILVSIINYRTADLTIACARSVLEAGLPEPSGEAGQGGHVVIVDNASGDGFGRPDRGVDRRGRARRPGSAWCARPDNAGFSGGHNAGMGFAPAAFYLILNSDAVLRPGFFFRHDHGGRAGPPRDRAFRTPPRGRGRHPPDQRLPLRGALERADCAPPGPAS